MRYLMNTQIPDLFDKETIISPQWRILGGFEFHQFETCLMSISRRNFIKTIGAATSIPALGSNVMIWPGYLSSVAPSDQVNIGLIGCRNRGYHVLRNHLKVAGVNCVALCDIDSNVLVQRSTELVDEGLPKPKLFEDFRRLLEDPDLDAVIIGTPDHWHCLPMVMACEAGKDVYVEKPLANSIAECDVMVKATHRYNRIVQVGQQQRSSEVWQQVMDFIETGQLGSIQKVDVWGNFNYGLGPNKVPDSPVPEGVNYDLFLGPAPERPFNEARFHGSWRFFWDYGGGLMTDWGVHLLDMALWAKKISRPAHNVTASGFQLELPDRSRETHDIMSAVFNYRDYMIQWEHNAGRQVGPYGRHYGVAFIGENGTLVADRSKWEVIAEYDPDKKMPKMTEVTPIEGQHGHQKHPENFIECIRSRAQPACPIEIGRAVAVNAHMANIAVRSGTHYLEWDESKSRFSNNRKANQYLMPDYRKPWKLPKI